MVQVRPPFPPQGVLTSVATCTPRWCRPRYTSRRQWSCKLLYRPSQRHPCETSIVLGFLTRLSHLHPRHLPRRSRLWNAPGLSPREWRRGNRDLSPFLRPGTGNPPETRRRIQDPLPHQHCGKRTRGRDRTVSN
jgi:hypothetical protein